MNQGKFIVIAGIIFILLGCKHEQDQLTQNSQNTQGMGSVVQSDQWNERRFAMFIHWGLYAIPGGVWQGKQISKGYSEQIMAHAEIPKDSYANLAANFNPTQWNAAEVAQLAKSAGMQTVVFTAKHHDGFCMFQSAHTEYDVIDATPYKQDVVKQLAEACAQQGLRFGVYYSLIDWHHPAGSPISVHNADPISTDLHQYNLKQIEELLSNYGQIDQLWLDMGDPSLQQSQDIRSLVKKIQPNCMLSGRIGNGQGDFFVLGDNQYPDYQLDAAWQVPASIFDETWGYRSWQKYGPVQAKAVEKLFALTNVVSGGGNFLLNIGPKGDGTIVPFEKEVLLNIGQWLNTNGTMVFNGLRSPFGQRTWGAVTVDKNGGKIYVHVQRWPEENQISLYGITNMINKIYSLENPGQEMVGIKNGKNLQIQRTPELGNSPFGQVLVIEFAGDLEVLPLRLAYAKGNSYVLNSQNATAYKAIVGSNYYATAAMDTRLKWNLNVSKPGKYEVILVYTNEEVGKSILFSHGKQSQGITLDKINAKEAPAPESVVYSVLKIAEPAYANASFEHVHGQVSDNNFSITWGEKNDRQWMDHENWLEKGDPYVLPGEGLNTVYAATSLFSSKDQMLYSVITVKDGLQLWANGREIAKKIVPAGQSAANILVEIPLLQSNNQLIYKFFNRSGTHLAAINHDVVVALYSKPVAKLDLNAGDIYPIEIKMEDPLKELGFVNFKILVNYLESQ